jgi:hypothetical protein
MRCLHCGTRKRRTLPDRGAQTMQISALPIEFPQGNKGL